MEAFRIAFWLALLLAFAILCQLVSIVIFAHLGNREFINISSSSWPVWAGYSAGRSVLPLAVGGLVPLIVWACLRFRRTALAWVLLLWATLTAGMTYMINLMVLHPPA